MDDQSASRKRHQFQALREAYEAEFPARLTAVNRLWDITKLGEATTEQRFELQRLIHGIAGSAGTFGYEQLGEKARELEEPLAALAMADGAPAAGPAGEIEAGLAQLHSLWHRRESTASRAPAVSTDRTLDPDNPRVYVIEDDGLLAQEMAAQLNALGWHSQVFSTAEDASRALERELPAAIIVDVMLPEGALAGPALVRHAQERSGRLIPHVCVSVRWDWDSRIEAAKAGAKGYFVKPVDIAELAVCLDAITQRRPGKPYRVLVLDDEAALADHYVSVLSAAGMDARAINGAPELLDALAEFSPELILMDLYMPDCTGIDAARVIRQDPQFAGVPIVFLSTESGRQQQLAAMQTGADDFLQKPIADADLIAAVSARAERFRALAAQIRQDSLTGLLNHISFKLQLESELLRARRTRSPLALAMIDIDHFKQINDSYGHPTGDRVIKSIAQVLRRRVRHTDVVGRYGGEEFAVLMLDTAPNHAVSIIDDIRKQFATVQHAGARGQFNCSFSAGVSSSPPLTRMDELIRVADHALYEAKRRGRNQVCSA